MDFAYVLTLILSNESDKTWKMLKANGIFGIICLAIVVLGYAEKLLKKD